MKILATLLMTLVFAHPGLAAAHEGAIAPRQVPDRQLTQARALPAPALAAQQAATTGEMPEPDVFLMMLVGLVLIGVRARGSVSSEKFTRDE
ncbi:MAG: hypothetical protein ACXU8N_21570 [Telluria sp.]